MVICGQEPMGLRAKQGGIIKTYTTDDGLNSNNIFGINEDPFGRIWLGTFGGVNILKIVEEDIEVAYLKTPYIPGNLILCMEKDSKDNFWFGNLYSS